MVSCCNPFSDAAARLFKVADGQIDQLGCGVIGWKAAAGFGGFPDHPVQALDCVGVSETLCMGLGPCRFHGSSVEPFGVQNSELITSGNPFSDAAARLFEISDCQIDQFGCGVIGREAAAGFGGFSYDPVQAFNRVGGVDDFAHRWRESKEGDHFLPRKWLGGSSTPSKNSADNMRWRLPMRHGTSKRFGEAVVVPQ